MRTAAPCDEKNNGKSGLAAPGFPRWACGGGLGSGGGGTKYPSLLPLFTLPSDPFSSVALMAVQGPACCYYVCVSTKQFADDGAGEVPGRANSDYLVILLSREKKKKTRQAPRTPSTLTPFHHTLPFLAPLE